MKKNAIVILGLIVLSATFLIMNRKGQNSTVNNPLLNIHMLIASPSFNNNDSIPKKFTCDGGNINPELHIQNVPEDAKSLALIMHDPDAPMPGSFTHWVVWNIAPATTVIKQENIPPGASEGWNSRAAGYTGPCPPSGTHRYFFKLYALDATLSLPSSTTKSGLESAMSGHIISQTELIGLYNRSNPGVK